MKTLSTIIIITFFSAAAFAQAGNLDSTFDIDGKVTTAIGDSTEYATSVAIQSDGKIVSTGYSWNGTDWDFALVRYNIDGTLDISFSTDGKATTAIGLGDDEAYSVAIQPDGKIVAAGWSYNSTDFDFALVRYNPDGTLDTSLSTDGKVTTAIGLNDDQAYSVAIQPDGRIVAAGVSGNDFALVRYNTDGTLDNSFSTDGKIITVIGIASSAYSMVIQPDGKIVAAGYSFNGTNNDFALIRYNTNGTLDISFSTDGKVSTAIGSDEDVAYSVAIQPNGKIVSAGFSDNGTDWDFALVRYNIDGTLDSNFSTDGKATTAIGSGYDAANFVAIQADGRIVAAGWSSSATGTDFALVRYNIDGTLDITFNTNGKVTTDFGSDVDVAHSGAIQPDGKIIVAGDSYNGMDYDFSLARYLSGLNVGILNFSPQSSPLIYPNPIHQTETLEYTLTQDEVLTLTLYDVNGREVKTFFIQHKRNAGSHKEQLNFGELPSGNYFLTLSNGGQKMTVKVVKQ